MVLHVLAEMRRHACERRLCERLDRIGVCRVGSDGEQRPSLPNDFAAQKHRSELSRVHGKALVECDERECDASACAGARQGSERVKDRSETRVTNRPNAKKRLREKNTGLRKRN